MNFFKRLKIQEIVTNLEIYNNRKVVTLIGTDAIEIQKRLRKLTKNNKIWVNRIEIGNGHIITNPTRRQISELGTCVIIIPRKPKTSQDYATLAHEALHATCYHLKGVGIKIGDESDEAHTYLMAYIIKDILDKAK